MMKSKKIFKKGDIAIPTDECISEKIAMTVSISLGSKGCDYTYFKTSKLYPVYATEFKDGEYYIIPWGGNMLIPEKYFIKSEINFNDIVSDKQSWIKVKKFDEDKFSLSNEDVDWKKAYKELLNHHKSETKFLIDRCKILAEECRICYDDIYIYDNGRE